MKTIKTIIICLIIFALCGFTACGEEVTNADKYEITVACQSEESEQEIVEILAEAFQERHPEYKINVIGFSGSDFENYMLTLSQNIEQSPNIVWTSDTTHSRWNEYFTDLRPFYESSPETDYSLYYETMLDTAGLNGSFKPTKNYTGSFRANDLDNSDGLEDYENHSEYGIYYAPRDYNKPAIVCNTALFAELDETYEFFMGANLPSDYQSTSARLTQIATGGADANWSELEDLFDFAKLVATRINYVVDATIEAGELKQNAYWKTKNAIDLKLSWEPTYVTILNALGVTKMFNDDGTFCLDNESETLEWIHNKLYEVDRICDSGADDTSFAAGYTFMKVVSRPVILGFKNTFTGTYGSASLQSIQIPVEDIAAGCSGYAINNYYHDRSVSVNGVTKSYDEICWDFIKFVITEDGQEVAGATGSNIPVLKSLYSTGAWRDAEGLEGMNHDAWVAGGELKQDWYDIFNPISRSGFRGVFEGFFNNFIKSNYGKETLSALFDFYKKEFRALDPTNSIRK